jgi:hypothetical protein
MYLCLYLFTAVSIFAVHTPNSVWTWISLNIQQNLRCNRVNVYGLFCFGGLCMMNSVKLYCVSECDTLYLSLLDEYVHPFIHGCVLQHFVFEMHKSCNLNLHETPLYSSISPSIRASFLSSHSYCKIRKKNYIRDFDVNKLLLDICFLPQLCRSVVLIRNAMI